MSLIARAGAAQTNDAPAVSSSAAETNPTSTPAATTSKAALTNFDEQKKVGDRALADGRLNDAIRAYMNALDVHEDPLVSGRLGLTLTMWEDPKLWVAAAPYLHDAVSAAAGTSQAERRQFFEAYIRVRRHVCRLAVKVSDVNIAVDIGNGKMMPSEGAFWSFIERGTHVLIAHLDGHDDIRKPYECLRGEDLSLMIAFPAPNKPAPELVTIIRSAEPKTIIIREPVVPPKSSSRPDKPWRFGGGVSALFGVAPSPAIGVTALASYRWTLRPRWAMSVDGGLLAGWTPFAIRDAINTSAIVAHGAACAHYRIVFGCPVVAIGAVRYSFVLPEFPANEPVTKFVYAGGLRIGLEHFWGSAIGIRAYGDLFKLGDRQGVDIHRYGLVWPGTEIAGTLVLGIVGKL